MISEIKGNYSRPDILSLGPNHKSNLGDFLGIPNANTGTDETSGLPLMEMRPTTFAAVGETQWVPLQIYNRTSQIAGSITIARNAHNLKFGAGVVLRSFGVLQSNSAQGLWGFDSTTTNSGSPVQQAGATPSRRSSSGIRQTCAGCIRRGCRTTIRTSRASSCRMTGARPRGSP